MAVVTIRARQNSETFDRNGGTRQPNYEIQDAVTFMDAIRPRRTLILDSITKGGALTEKKPRVGLRQANPRSSKVAADIANNVTAITVPTGHGARFQQGHVLLATHLTTKAQCRFWVADDPGNDSLTVQAVDTQLAMVAGSELTIIGIAMPEGSNFPLAPVSRAMDWTNEWQEFSKSLEHTLQGDKTPSVEFPNGGIAASDMLQIGKDIKEDLDRALLLGYRKRGVPDHAAPYPSMLGGILYMAELSGNVYNVGGDDVALTHTAVEFVQHEMEVNYGERAGTKYVMSWKTKQIFNRLISPLKYNRGIEGNTVSTKWDTLETEYDDIQFTHMHDFPDGVILVYKPSNLKYHPFAGADWKEKDFPTKGFSSWKGLGGIYTLIANDVPGMALIRGFDTNLAHYPDWSRPSTFFA